MTTKILCVADGGITPDMMRDFTGLEEHGANVTIVEDKDMGTIGDITDRMGLLERSGIDAAPSCQELLDNVSDAEILVVHVASVNREVLAAAPNLKLVAVLRGGIENADTEALKERGITLINAPWRSANAVADFTVGMMIAENKNIARSHHLLKEGTWCKKYVNQAYIRDLRKCTIGLIGLGHIGSRVAQRLVGFESQVIAFDPFAPADMELKHGVTRVDSLEELLTRSDFVSLHLRISPESHHIINADTLALMKPTAYLINTARADLVDEVALAEALRQKSIGGAAIDVYSLEPLEAGHPFLELDNVTLTSHLAGTSADTMQTSVEIGVGELERYFNDQPLQTVCA
ncbi:2-hydroxyacid dehydrogenase [Flaviflexus huanghaiensis]|uniref:2-hydroxyacid dehydrogenase n=1 Tax=Flaviflexus huanghaiensis TaxID=1111473 RepID=UPI0015FB3D28|nr:2-hydroxyacid dehydrogenase [Flaviflexus huanghaiensis]